METLCMANTSSEGDTKSDVRAAFGGTKTPPTRDELISGLFDGLDASASEQAKSTRDILLSRYVEHVVHQHSVSTQYNLLVLYDNSRMVKKDADNIYSAVLKFSEIKPLLIILHSTGGSAAAAYLIGKLCREYAHGNLVVAVPRQAKSAATLLACAADEIHMGSLSELGPIDPQIDEMPALGLKNAVEHIAELVKTHPSSAEMFAKYLAQSLPLINLGYYERVAESAMHYADRLLRARRTSLPRATTEIAKQLVYGYKDHGFVIDKSEAKSIFGDGMIKSVTEEYNLANELYQELQMIWLIADITGHHFHFIGSPPLAGTFTPKSRRSPS
jgi:hypothetical protein